MNTPEKNQIYRASIGAIIVDDSRNFLLGQIPGILEKDVWDFVKGGMHIGESNEETLEREIQEEIGEDVHYEILERSNWVLVYEWDKERQERKGYRGQTRVNYWVRYIDGEIKADPLEFTNIQWIAENDLKGVMEKGGFSAFEIQTFLLDWERIREQYFSKNK